MLSFDSKTKYMWMCFTNIETQTNDLSDFFEVKWVDTVAASTEL